MEGPMSEERTPSQAVNALSDRFWDGLIELSPISATVLGYPQGMDRLDDTGPAGREKLRRLYECAHAPGTPCERFCARRCHQYLRRKPDDHR